MPCCGALGETVAICRCGYLQGKRLCWDTRSPECLLTWVWPCPHGHVALCAIPTRQPLTDFTSEGPGNTPSHPLPANRRCCPSRKASVRPVPRGPAQPRGWGCPPRPHLPGPPAAWALASSVTCPSSVLLLFPAARPGPRSPPGDPCQCIMPTQGAPINHD